MPKRLLMNFSVPSISFNKLFRFQLTLFITLLFLWNIFTPVLEGADEHTHFCQASYIAHRNKIPNLTIRDGCFLDYQPLYYLILTPIIKLFQLEESSKNYITVNPNFSKLRDGEYSQYVHNQDELFFKWDKFQLMIHVLRVISSIFAVLIFTLTWRISQSVFKNKIYGNLALLLFLNPMFLHIFTTLTNVVLVTLLATVFIMIDINFVTRTKSYKVMFLQGLIFGLGVISKISMFVLSFAFLYTTFRNLTKGFLDKLPGRILSLNFFVAGILVAAGWYMLRSYKLYGEILEINVAAPYRGEHHWNLLSEIGPFNFWHSFITTMFRTFWSGYGGLTINFPSTITVFLLIIFLMTAIAIFKSRKNLDSYLKICIFYIISALVGLVLINLKTAAMHAKDLFVVYLPMALVFGFGVVKAVEIAKKNKLTKTDLAVVFFISLYFFAQQEIVGLIKSTFRSLTYANEFSQALSNLGIIFFKSLIVMFMIWAILFSLKRLNINSKTIFIVTNLALFANIVIIMVSAYLFYFKFW